jgi:hypothetical protein
VTFDSGVPLRFASNPLDCPTAVFNKEGSETFTIETVIEIASVFSLELLDGLYIFQAGDASFGS